MFPSVVQPYRSPRMMIGQLGDKGAYTVFGADCYNNAVTPNTKYDLFAGVVVLNNVELNSVVHYGPTQTCDISVVGPGGRDQVTAFSANSWVHFWWIGNSKTISTIASASSAQPNRQPGFTHWSYAGAVRLNGSSQLTKTMIKGGWCYYDAAVTAISSQAASHLPETAVSLASLVPPNAFSVSGILTGSVNVTTANAWIIDLRVRTGVVFAALNGASGGAYSSIGGGVIFPNVGQNCYVSSSGAGTLTDRFITLTINGYSIRG